MLYIYIYINSLAPHSIYDPPRMISWFTSPLALCGHLNYSSTEIQMYTSTMLGAKHRVGPAQMPCQSSFMSLPQKVFKSAMSLNETWLGRVSAAERRKKNSNVYFHNVWACLKKSSNQPCLLMRLDLGMSQPLKEEKKKFKCILPQC